VKQSFANFFAGVHWNDQQAELDWMAKLSMTSGLSRAKPPVGFKKSH